MDPLFAILLIIALLAGAALGWFMGSRPVAEWKQRHGETHSRAEELDGRFRQAIVDLENASVRAQRAEALAEQLEIARAERERLGAELATLKANAANFDEQKRLLMEARAELLKEFQLTGSQVLGRAQEEFLKNASERFGHAEKANKEAVAALLRPVDERLKSYERQVSELEAKRVDAFGQLTGLIQSMREGQQAVQAEAMKLSSALANAPKARGRWGERALQNVLEQCGLTQHTDFFLEQSVDTDDGRLRPDAIVRIPGKKMLVVDAKVSLKDYLKAFETEDSEARRLALLAHARSMKTHVQQLGAKSYQSQFEEAPDYVVMFVPGEHFVAAALEADPDLWDFAFRNNVLLATPTNLVAIARTVAQVWRQDALAQEARAIGKLAGELYGRIRTAGDHLRKVGVGLESAVKNYNNFVGSYERNVMSSARKLSDKGIDIGKGEIEEIQLVESSPRYTAADTDEAKGPRLVENGPMEGVEGSG